MLWFQFALGLKIYKPLSPCGRDIKHFSFSIKRWKGEHKDNNLMLHMWHSVA